MISLAPLNAAVPEEVAANVAEVEEAIRSGNFHPFQGPVEDQDGNVVIAEGTTISDEDLLRMEFYVEGVQGKLPK